MAAGTRTPRSPYDETFLTIRLLRRRLENSTSQPWTFQGHRLKSISIVAPPTTRHAVVGDPTLRTVYSWIRLRGIADPVAASLRTQPNFVRPFVRYLWERGIGYSHVITCSDHELGVYTLPFSRMIRSPETGEWLPLPGWPDSSEGNWSHVRDDVARQLEARFPDSRIDTDCPNPLQTILEKTTVTGLVTGVPQSTLEAEAIRTRERAAQPSGFAVPTVNVAARRFLGESLEALIRAGTRQSGFWWFQVVCSPVSEQSAIAARRKRLETVLGLSPKATAKPDARIAVESELCERLVGVDALRFQLGLTDGLWLVSCYFGASDESVGAFLSASLTEAFKSEAPLSEPIRSRIIPGDGILIAASSLSHLRVEGNQILQVRMNNREELSSMLALPPSPRLCTPLLSIEVCTLVRPPAEETLGYSVLKEGFATVDAEQDPLIAGSEAKPWIELGSAIEGDATRRDVSESRTGPTIRIPAISLARHLLVAGITGSGKSTTVERILVDLNRNGIPFLVVEPVKQEYRNLVKWIPDLRVFSVGEGGPARFWLNPLEVPEGVVVQSHLDRVAAAFEGFFYMGGALPQVFKELFYNTYRNLGWELSLRAGPMTANLQIPTLTQLYWEVGRLPQRYEPKEWANFTGALRTRIGDLMRGSNGRTFNCVTSIPMQSLLERPVVLELRRMTSDDERALFTTLLLGRLYSFLETHPPGSSRLKHVTVLEEAHRFLSLSGAQSRGEFRVNPRRGALEMFGNLIAEARAYGEGITIVDQLPTALSPEVIKGTATKILHQTVATDDQAALGSAASLSEEEFSSLGRLRAGQCVLSSEALRRPLFLQVTPLRLPDGASATPISDELLDSMAQRSPDVGGGKRVNPLASCEYCFDPCSFVPDADPYVYAPEINRAVQSNMDRLHRALWNLCGGPRQSEGPDKSALEDYDRELLAFAANSTQLALERSIGTGIPVSVARGIAYCAVSRLVNTLMPSEEDFPLRPKAVLLLCYTVSRFLESKTSSTVSVK